MCQKIVCSFAAESGCLFGGGSGLFSKYVCALTVDGIVGRADAGGKRKMRYICDVCPRGCRLKEGQIGFCRVRMLRDGRNICRTYGAVAALHIAPSEIKPFFHFKPAARWLSVGGLGCNLRCPGCQNHHIAHSRVRDEELSRLQHLEPGQLVRLAKEAGCVGLSFTYNEPIIWWEYVVDAGYAAKEAGLLMNLVTNGYACEGVWRRLLDVCDAVRIDFKGFSEEVTRRAANLGQPEVVRRNAKIANDLGVHVEIISNIIPTINDAEDELRATAEWIVENLGVDVAWHLTRFVPHLRLSHLPPTPLETLEKGREIGLAAGLRFVYLGNVPGHPAENTYCPQCGACVVRRFHTEIVAVNIRNGRCAKCGAEIPIVW